MILKKKTIYKQRLKSCVVDMIDFSSIFSTKFHTITEFFTDIFTILNVIN